MDESTLRDVVDAVNRYGTKAAAARHLNMPVTTLKDRYKAAQQQNIAAPDPPDSKTQDAKPSFEFTESDNEASIWSVGDSVRTVDDAIAKAEINLREWSIVEKTVNSWPTAMKLSTGSKQENNFQETPHQVWNWQVKVKLRRKAPRDIQHSVKELVEELRNTKLSPPARTKKKRKNPHMLELALHDVHFGKLAWAEEVGGDYDLKIANAVYEGAIHELLERVQGFDIDKVLLPIGHDFFQCNNFSGTTAAGTQVDHDGRFPKVFKAGCQAVRRAILACREMAEVEVVWVPGNHDPETSWFMTEVLSAYFESDKHVTVDNSPAYRKYRSYGITLLALTHGNEEKHRDLPLIMATEVPELWATAKHREIHLGHYHKAKEMVHMGTDEHAGVRVRVLPSLSGTDSWHFRKGFVKNMRAAESYLWSFEDGYTGHFSANATL